MSFYKKLFLILLSSFLFTFLFVSNKGFIIAAELANTKDCKPGHSGELEESFVCPDDGGNFVGENSCGSNEYETCYHHFGGFLGMWQRTERCCKKIQGANCPQHTGALYKLCGVDCDEASGNNCGTCSVFDDSTEKWKIQCVDYTEFQACDEDEFKDTCSRVADGQEYGVITSTSGFEWGNEGADIQDCGIVEGYVSEARFTKFCDQTNGDERIRYFYKCCVATEEKADSEVLAEGERCEREGGSTFSKGGCGYILEDGYDWLILWEHKINNEEYYCCRQISSDPNRPDPITVDPNIISLTQDNLNKINPLTGSVNFGTREKRTPANIINVAMRKVVFPLAGSLLFLLLIIGGYQILSASLTGKQNYIEIGKQRVTSAIIGFILLFATYWLWRILMIALGIQ